jgi:cell division protein FtsB
MKNLDTHLSLLLFLSLCLLGSGCTAPLKNKVSQQDATIRQKDATIQEQTKQINNLEKANDDCKSENKNLSHDVVRGKEKIAELEKQKSNGSGQKPGNSSLTYYLALAQAECEKAGKRFKQDDFLDINEHAANALAAVTAMKALHEASGESNSGLEKALDDAKENAEGLVVASAKKIHNDSHDHHEHLEGALKIVDRLTNK